MITQKIAKAMRDLLWDIANSGSFDSQDRQVRVWIRAASDLVIDAGRKLTKRKKRQWLDITVVVVPFAIQKSLIFGMALDGKEGLKMRLGQPIVGKRKGG